MQLAHTLENRKVLNIFRLDFIREQVVVGAFTFLRLFISGSGERNMFGNNGFDLCRHFFDLCVCQVLNAEVIIFLKLILDNVVATVEGGNNILVKNLIA